MTLITFEDGKPLMKEDGKIGTGLECCCENQGCCVEVEWHRVYGDCWNRPDDFIVAAVDATCYAYYVDEDLDCINPLVGRDCGGDGQGNVYARVLVTGDTTGEVEYLQSQNPDVYGAGAPGVGYTCDSAFGSLSVSCVVEDNPLP